MGWRGVGAHRGLRHPSLRAEEAGLGGGRRDPCGRSRRGWASRRGPRRLRSPGRACPARRTNPSHIQGESSPARPRPLPASRHLSQWRGAGGGRGSGGGKPSQSHYLCPPSSPRTSAPEPAGLSPAARSRARRAPFSPRPPGPPCLSGPAPPAARRRLLRWQSRGLPQQTCHPTPRKRAAPSRLLFVPPPGSCSGAASSRVARWRFGAPPSAGTCPGLRPSGPLRTRALFVLFFPCGLRAELGGGGAPSPEPAQVSVRAGRGRAGAGEEKVEAGAPGRAGLEPGWGGQPALGMTRQCGLPAPPRLPAEVRTRPRGLGSPMESGCAQGCGLGAVCVWPGAYRRGPRTSAGTDRGRVGVPPPWWAQVEAQGREAGADLGWGRVSAPRASFSGLLPGLRDLSLPLLWPRDGPAQSLGESSSQTTSSPLLRAHPAWEPSTRSRHAAALRPPLYPCSCQRTPGAPELCFGVGSPTACLGPLTGARILELGCQRAVRGSGIARFRGTLWAQPFAVPSPSPGIPTLRLDVPAGGWGR